jgi:hypothetical protein
VPLITDKRVELPYNARLANQLAFLAVAQWGVLTAIVVGLFLGELRWLATP